MVKIRITDAGSLKKVIADLTGFENGLEDREEALERVKERQIERWQRNFASQGGEYQSWAPSAAATQASRMRRGFSPTPTLMVTGRTLAHFTQQNEEGSVSSSAINWNFENQPLGDRWASTVSLHTGYRLRGNRVPSRMLWDLDRKDEDALKEEFEEFIGELQRRFSLD